MTDMEIPHSLTCDHCEGRGYVGNAYWDEELEWYIFQTNGASCEHCQGTGLSGSIAAFEGESTPISAMVS